MSTDYTLYDRLHATPPHPEHAALGMTDAAVQAAGGLELVKARLAEAEHEVEAAVHEVATQVEQVVEEVKTDADAVVTEVEGDVKEDLTEIRNSDLAEMARELGAEVKKGMNKDTLIALIEHARELVVEAVDPTEPADTTEEPSADTAAVVEGDTAEEPATTEEPSDDPSTPHFNEATGEFSSEPIE